MQKTKRVSRWVSVCLISVMAVPAAVFAQDATGGAAEGDLALLKAIPEGAAGFLALRNLKELDADIQAISAQVGFPLGGPEAMFPAPLEWLKASLQLTEGLRENGGAALVLLNGREIKTTDEIPDRLILYIPATDPKALVTSLGGEEGTNGLYKVDLGGSPSVAALREDYVLLAKAPEEGESTPEALIAAAKFKGEGVAKEMAADRLKAYAKQDLFLWVNFQAVSNELRAEIVEGLRGVFAGLGAMSMGGADPAQTDQAVEQIDKFFTQAQEFSFGISLNAKAGLGMSFYSRVKPDSEIAKTLAANKPPEGSVLAGLPDEDFIFAFGTVVGTTPESLDQMRKTFEGVAKQVAALDTDEGSPLTAENLKPLIDTWVDQLKNTQQAAMSVSKLGTGQGTDSLVGLAVVVQVQDAKAWQANVRETFAKVKQMAAGVAKADGAEQEQIDAVMAAFVWQENAGEVAGAPVDLFKVDFEKIPDASPEDVERMKAILGPEGVTVRVAAVGEHHVVVAMGGGEERLAKIIGLIKENQAPLAKSPKLALVAGRMPSEGKQAEGYFSLDSLLQTVDAGAARLQMQGMIPVKLALPDSAPIGFTTIAVDKTAQQADVLIPSELIIAGAKFAREQLVPMMMGGMGGMGGGQMGMEEPTEPSDQEPAEPSQE